MIIGFIIVGCLLVAFFIACKNYYLSERNSKVWNENRTEFVIDPFYGLCGFYDTIKDKKSAIANGEYFKLLNSLKYC
jgi:hypothetical protein